MKIAIIVPGFSAHERDWCIPALLNFVRSLSPAVEVRIYTLRFPQIARVYSVFGATVHAMGGQDHMGPGALVLWARTASTIAAEHRRRPFDAIHAFWADEPAWVAALAGDLLGVPVVVSVAGGELLSLREINYGALLLPGRRALSQWALRRAARITVGSHYMQPVVRRQVPPHYWHKIVYAPLGVDTDMFFPSGGNAARGRLNIINVGSLTPVKNHRLLLEALAKTPSAALTIAGDGALGRELQAYAVRLNVDSRVRWAGETPHDALPGLYCQHDIFAQSSRHEAQGMAALEAAACGLRLIGTGAGVLPQLGTVAATAEDLAEAVQRPLTPTADDLRQTVVSEFSLPVARERFQSIYAAVASRR